MKRTLSVCVWIALTIGARADVIEFQNGAKSEGRILALFNQRFEFADKDGSVTRVKLQDVKRIDFDSRVAAVTLRDHTIINGKLLGLEDGVLTVGITEGAPRHVAAVEVTDLTARGTNAEAPGSQPHPSQACGGFRVQLSPSSQGIHPA